MAIDKIGMRQLRQLNVMELDKLLEVNGGMIIIQVDNQAKYCLSCYPRPHLPNFPNGRCHSSLIIKEK